MITVAALVVAIGAALGTAAARRGPSLEIAVLGVGSAFAFVAVDVVSVALAVIGPIYLLDAAAQALLLAGWAAALTSRNGDRGS